MRLFLLRLFTVLSCIIVLSVTLKAQSFSFSCTRDTVIAGCAPNPCFTLKGIIPNIFGLTDRYMVNPIGTTPTACRPVYAQPDDPGGTPTNLSVDDTYSGVINMGFNFPFYGTIYNSLIASTNGMVSFDISKAGAFAHFATPGDLPNASYDAAIIMGPYHDLDPSVGSSPNQRIQYQTLGTAPHRRWVLSFFRVPLFSIGGVCDPLIENTHQIVLYESTGIIEVIVFSKQICTSWQQGKAMIGMQDFTKTQAIMVPGRRVSDPAWGTVGMNEAYRFVPTSGPSLFKRVELYDIGGTLLSTGTTIANTNATLEASFPNICPPAGATTTYIIRSVYTKIDDPTVEIFGTDTVRVTKGPPTDLNATFTAVPTACGPPSGSITVNVPGGTAPFTYVLDGGAPQVVPLPTFTFNNLGAGLHTVVVTDASGVCSSTIPVTITQNNNLTANITPVNTSCPGVNNGSISVIPTTGTGPFTFTLNPGAVVQTGPTALYNGLAAGAYTITIQDASGCTAAAPFTATVSAGAGITANFTQTATTCAGANNGTITVTPTNGTAPFTFVLDGTTTLTGVTATFTGLASGIHNITITDNTGCTANPPLSVPVASGATLSAAQAITPTSCTGATNGTALITPTNGTGPYTFVLDGTVTQTGATSTTFTGLAAGPHAVVITDASGCISNPVPVNIPAGAALAATQASTPTSCAGAANGTALITPTNGMGPYTFVLDGTVTQTGPTSTTFTGLAAGPHAVVITDASGCVSNPVPVNIPAGAALTTAVNRTDVLCNGGLTGSITITPPAGTAPFSYSLDGTNWQAGNTFTGLGAGSYTAYFREGNGCQGSQPVTINEPPVLTATAAGVPVICNGASNGTVTLTPSGGTAPYQYAINGGPFQASNVFNVPAGNYTIIIRDGNGCTDTRTTTITEPAVLAASSGTANASCDGGNDGRITVTATGGNNNYQYSVDGTNFQSSNVFNIGPGNYTVTVRDNLGCITQFPATVGLTNNLTVSRQTDPTICESKSVQLQLTSNATVYSWLPATGLSNPAIPNPMASPVVTTEYIVTATLGRCSADDTVIVNVNPAPVPDAGENAFICYGQNYQLQGSGGIQYTWTPSTYLNRTDIPNPVSTPTQTITYTLSKVIDANGCESLVTDAMTLDVTPPIKVSTFPADTIAYEGDQFQIQAASLANMYIWSPAMGLSDPAVSNPVVTVGNAGDDVLYQVTASTAAGCRGEGYVRIRVYKGPDIYMPSAFTPNNDNKNDRFVPLTVGIKEINYFKIFNRWGREVFSTKKIHEGWDGKLAGLEQPAGVYVWIVQGVTKDDRIITKKGTVVIIR